MTNEVTVTFLGTASAPPQINRRQSAISVKYRSNNLLVDTGEAVQVQMLKYKVRFKNLIILFTHLHSDHTQGLMGILATRNFYNIKTPITIIGPPWTSSFIFLQLLSYRFYPEYKINVIETDGGIAFSNNDLSIESFKVNHSEESLGYKILTHQPLGKFNIEKAEKLGIPKGELWKSLQEGNPIELNGRIIHSSEVLDSVPNNQIKIVISGDTALDQEVLNHSSHADLLIHDSTYPFDQTERATKYKHSTCVHAAQIGKHAKVRKLVLTHISELHKNLEETLNHAKTIFPDTILAEDGLQLKISSRTA